MGVVEGGGGVGVGEGELVGEGEFVVGKDGEVVIWVEGGCWEGFC